MTTTAPEVSLNGWSAEAEAALAGAYHDVIANLNIVTGLDFKPEHTGGNVWNLTASLGRGRSVSVADSDALHVDFDGTALDQWAACFYDEDDEPANVATVQTDLTVDGAVYAVAVALLWTTPDPA